MFFIYFALFCFIINTTTEKEVEMKWERHNFFALNNALEVTDVSLMEFYLPMGKQSVKRLL